MFTGLVEDVGGVAAVAATESGARLRIVTRLAAALAPGDSVAVNGVCLTATAVDAEGFAADVGPETARVTTLGSVAPGQRVNLERALRADSRMGGHFVQGHIDATGTIRALRTDGESHRVAVSYPSSVAPYLIRRGSIAADGVSLTIAELTDATFEVMIIPFTWQHTALSSLREGAVVNLECDLLGKYVARALEVFSTAPVRAEPTS